MSHFVYDECEVTGIWHNMGQGCRLLIARARNPKYMKLIAALRKPHEREIDMGTLSDTNVTEILVKGMARTILLDWEGLADADGKDIPHSIDNCEALLRDYEEFRVEVGELSADNDRYRSDKIREDAETLGNVSSGASDSGSLSKSSIPQSGATTRRAGG